METPSTQVNDFPTLEQLPPPVLPDLVEDLNLKDKDLIQFDKEFRSLLKQLEEVLEESESASVCSSVLAMKKSLKKGSKSSPLLLSLRKYVKAFEITDSSEHEPYVLKLYETGKDNYILNPDKIDVWLSGGVKILYGEGNKKVEQKKICVYLGAIYRTAKQMEKETSARLEAAKASDEEYAKSYALIRCDAIKLHLLRMFSAVIPEKRKELQGSIVRLEANLGIKKDSDVKTEAMPALDGIAGLAKSVLGGAGLEGLLGNLTKGMQSAGAANGGGGGPPAGDVGEIIRGLVNNDTLKNTMGNLMQGIQKCGNLQDVIGVLSSQLGDPKLQEALAQSLPGMVPAATAEATESPMGLLTQDAPVQNIPVLESLSSDTHETTPAVGN